jgi:hypothetical protein
MPLWSGEKLPCRISVTVPLGSISIRTIPTKAKTIPSPGIERLTLAAGRSGRDRDDRGEENQRENARSD